MATKKRKRRRYKTPTKAEIAAMVRKTLRPSYRVFCYYQGFDDRDDAITKLTRCPASGSGTCLITGLRDLEFDFGSRKASALKAAARIKDARIRGVHVMIDSVERI